jgi:DNA-directed RNA polymerase specialized sigma24 family protein
LPDSTTKKEITREDFARFLAWLSPDRERAGEEYERLRFRLCTFFSQRRCSFADELADETISRVIVKSGEEKIESRIAYFYGVAKNVYRESLRKERSHLNVDELTIASQEPEKKSISSECLDDCLNHLPVESRTLVLDYFSEARRAKIQLHRRMSQELATTDTALRMRVGRIKLKLKICVQECMSY